MRAFICIPTKNEKSHPVKSGLKNSGADNGIRTRDPHLGKVMLYQLSHVRVNGEYYTQSLYLAQGFIFKARKFWMPGESKGHMKKAHSLFVISTCYLYPPLNA